MNREQQPTLPDRRGPSSTAEVEWFRTTGFIMRSEPPLATHHAPTKWASYVAWLLGDEAGLTAREDFQRHCSRCHRDGLIASEAAREWKWGQCR